MVKKNKKFNALICGKKDFVSEVRKYFVDTDPVHIQFVSSPQFMPGRALFTKPDIVVLDATVDNKQLRNSIYYFIESEQGIPVYALSRLKELRSAVELIKMGLSEYFVFPDEEDKIKTCFEKEVKEWNLKNQREELTKIREKLYDFSQIIGETEEIKELLRRAKKNIESNTKTVLITGETGTGKELLARAVHYNSIQSSHPFVDIGCSTIPENLLESELFGHERGAFTDAKDRKLGLFELAGEGTIFLDEIGDIAGTVQSKLLKVIESRVLRRIGGTRDIPVRAKIIAATSIDLKKKVSSGEFRRDLYHRLKILPLELPPLRRRRNDIPSLVDFFIQQYNELYSKNIKGISPKATKYLMEKEWEGNVRELKHAVERAVLMCEDKFLNIDDFEIEGHRPDKIDKIDSKTFKKLSGEISCLISLQDTSLDKIQKEILKLVLESVDGNKSKAASILKISRPRLLRMLN